MVVCDYCGEEILEDKADMDAIVRADYHPECRALVIADIKKIKGDRPDPLPEAK